MTIRLQFVTETSIESALIRWFSAGHLSHVDCIMPNGQLFGARSDSVGGQPPGVWARPPDYAPFTRRVIAEIPTTPLQQAAFYEFLRKQRGCPYDTEAIWAFAFNRDWREDDSWICSELQARALEVAHIFPHPLYLTANKIVPVSLALTVSANAEIVELREGEPYAYAEPQG